jgi:hypothetical protein
LEAGVSFGAVPPFGNFGSVDLVRGASSSSSGGWRKNREDFAAFVNPSFDGFAYSNLLDGGVTRGGTVGTGAPSLQAGFSGGILTSPGGTKASAGYLGLNPVGGTVDSALIAFPTAESWLVGARVRCPQTDFTVGRFCVLVGLVAIYLESQPAVNTKQLYLNLNDGTDHFFTTGAKGVIGSATAPFGAFFWIGLGFNIQTGVLTPYFSDEAGTPRSGSDLLHMPSAAAAPIYGYSNDGTMGLLVSDIFAAWVTP